MDIREFLEARLAEDEAVALNALHPDAVKPGWWMTEHQHGDPPVCHIAEDRAGNYWSVAHDVFVPNAEHMARHDPARVLRDVEAKRRILAIHSNHGHDQYCVDSADPCIELRALAGIWPHHPDYDLSWSPT